MTDPLSMMSQIILIGFVAWLLIVAFYALSAPEKAKVSLSKFGSTPLIHFGEHILRVFVGAAFVGASTISAYPIAFKVIGGFLIISSLLIMVLPRKWHHAYAVFWAGKLSPAFIRIAGLFTIFAATALIKQLPFAMI